MLVHLHVWQHFRAQVALVRTNFSGPSTPWFGYSTSVSHLHGETEDTVQDTSITIRICGVNLNGSAAPLMGNRNFLYISESRRAVGVHRSVASARADNAVNSTFSHTSSTVSTLKVKQTMREIGGSCLQIATAGIYLIANIWVSWTAHNAFQRFATPRTSLPTFQ